MPLARRIGFIRLSSPCVLWRLTLLKVVGTSYPRAVCASPSSTGQQGLCGSVVWGPGGATCKMPFLACWLSKPVDDTRWRHALVDLCAQARRSSPCPLSADEYFAPCVVHLHVPSSPARTQSEMELARSGVRITHCLAHMLISYWRRGLADRNSQMTAMMQSARRRTDGRSTR